ncbi:MAG: FAD:protein FMN transferase [Oliverpabstia sp.]
MKTLAKMYRIACTCILATVLYLAVVYLPNTSFHRLDDTNQNETTTELFAMDTYITMTAYGRDAETALMKAANKLTELERLWSVTTFGSDIYAINHSGGLATVVSEETKELLSFAFQIAEETDGALEPTIYPVLTAWGFTTGENHIPSDSEIAALLQNVGYERVSLKGNSVRLDDGMMLDLGSVGKGYAGEIASQVLRDNGITSALLDIGGNIQAVGTKPDGSPWRLGLRDPFSGGNMGVLEISNMAVVTSGNYERYFIGEDGKKYGHIIDPSTGLPAESGLMSVTVISEEGRLCDALSTAIFVMGRDRAVKYWRQCQNFDLILITEEGEVYLTESIAEVFTLDRYHSNTKVNVIEYEKAVGVDFK